MTDKQRFPRHEALAVADEFLAYLMPFCDRIAIAGSLRRRKPDVGDIEILYIPGTEEREDVSKLFEKKTVNLVDEELASLVEEGFLERRKNSLGREVYGEKNKLMRHVPSGIPVDLFAATTDNWWSLFVCRTGPAELNVHICSAAQAKGWKWKPYEGFTDEAGRIHYPKSEQEVFAFVGLGFIEPWERI
jgi:DNA polymerase (family 10)